MLGSISAPTLRRNFSTAIAGKLERIASVLPHKDAISYTTVAETGIVKWTFSDVNRYADAFAAGLTESDFHAGDKLATWLPAQSRELLVAQFAADKIGLLLVEVDVALAHGEALRDILNDTRAKGLLFDDALIRDGSSTAVVLEKALSELNAGSRYDNQYGVPFRSRAVPSMKLVMHTGLERRQGMQNMKYMMTYNPLPAVHPVQGIADDSPLSLVYQADGPILGPVAAEGALAFPSWSNVAMMLQKQYVTIE
jgi:acyl-CoA synthetase (AMP-forming)/AMP-acid ligase II